MTRRRSGKSHRSRRLTIEAPIYFRRGPESTTHIRTIAFDAKHFSDEMNLSVETIQGLKGKTKVLWVDLEGLEDHELIEEIGKTFDIHRLALEDVRNPQRSKVDIYKNQFFVVMPQLHESSENDLVSQQICICIGPGFVVTFHEGPWHNIGPIVDRIKNEVGTLKTSGPDYLVYALVDSIVDSYFPLLERFGEMLENLETQIIENPSRQSIADVHGIKRDLLILRRATWPIRETINALIRDGGQMFHEETIMHLRDCYDEAFQVIDFIETYRELGADLMDVYLSSISNRMNEVMKVLTIITTIFVPPTFLAGVYGMNFNHAASPYNMPELEARYGYPLCLLGMAMMALSVIILMWWKGWLGVLATSPNPIEPEKKPLFDQDTGVHQVATPSVH